MKMNLRFVRGSGDGQSYKACKGKASEEVMEKETCFVSITSNFARVWIIKPKHLLR